MKKTISALFITIFIYMLFSLNVAGQAIQKEQTDPMDEYNRILILVGKKDYNHALEGLKAILTKTPDFYRAYRLMVTVTRYKKDIPSVITFFENLKKRNPKNGTVEYGIGYAYFFLKQYEKAIKHLKISIQLQPDLFYSNQRLAIAYLKKKGDKTQVKREAELYFNSLIKKNPESASAYFGLGELYYQQRRWDQGLFMLNKAIELDPNLWDAYALKSTIYYYKSEFQKVHESLYVALKGAVKLKDLSSEGRILGRIGTIHRNLGNYNEALKYLKQAIQISRDTGNKRAEESHLNNIGVIFQSQGYYEKALVSYREALVINRETKLLKSKGIILGNVGNVYCFFGDYHRAMEYFKKTLKLHGETGYMLGKGIMLKNIGYLYKELGNYPEALVNYKQALAIHTKIGNKKFQGQTLGMIGYVYHLLGEYEKALAHYDKALAILSETGNKKGEGVIFNYFGFTNLALKKYEKSLTYHQNALKIFQKINRPELIRSALKGLADNYLAQKKYDKSFSCLRKAIQNMEFARSELKLKERKAGFMAKRINYYEAMIHLLYEMHLRNPAKSYDKECFYYIEKAKARAFFENLQEEKIDLKKNLSAEIKTEEHRITSEISNLQTNLFNPKLSDREREKIEKKIKNLEDQYQHLLQRIKREHPEYASIIHHKPYKLEKIQNQLASNDTALIEYFLTENEAFLAIITRDDFSIQKLVNSRIILERVTNYIELLSEKGATEFRAAIAGEKLFQELLGPVQNKLKGIKKLIFVSDNQLHYLPFEALIMPGTATEPEFLVEKFQITYAPSASSLVTLLSRKREPKFQMAFLGFADPVFNPNETSVHEMSNTRMMREISEEKGFDFNRLPFTSTEIQKISAHFPAKSKKIYSRSDATEEMVKETNLSKYRIIHFATHGFLDEQIPSRSSLIFTLDSDPKEDGFFQVREIYDTRLNAELVVLSACNTGKGKLEKGEGVSGLSRAFLNAGAQSVVMSLWNINDIATSEFMARFYKYLMEGISKAEALQKVKIQMIHSKYSHPSFWAAFVLNGDSKNPVN